MSSCPYCILQYLKPQKVDFEPRNRKKGAGKTGRLERRKKGVREERKRDEVRDFVRKRQLRTEDSESEDNSNDDNSNDDKDSSTDQKETNQLRRLPAVSEKPDIDYLLRRAGDHSMDVM